MAARRGRGQGVRCAFAKAPADISKDYISGLANFSKPLSNGGVLHRIDWLRFVSLTDTEKEKINNRALRSRSRSGSVLQAGEKFSQAAARRAAPLNLDQLADHAHQLFNRADLEVGKLKPFFWMLAETYLDRFQALPFDATRALFCHLELQGYPREEFHQLAERLASLYEKQFGEPLSLAESAPPVPDTPRERTDPTAAPPLASALDEDIASLRDCLKYAALVNEV